MCRACQSLGDLNMIYAKALLILSLGGVAQISPAQSASVDLSPLGTIDTLVFAPGTCGPAEVVHPSIMVTIECSETSNPVISFNTGALPDHVLEFHTSDDIQAACERSTECMFAESLSVNGWSGGFEVYAPPTGIIAKYVLTSGDATFQISSRDVTEEIARQNAAIALQIATDLILCQPWEGPRHVCPAVP